jgi:serine phosphatase RsbU (regulator of sigma subunit)
MVTEIDRYTRENIRLAQETQRVETELKLASSIQRAMLQSRFPESEDYVLSASMVPAKEVGGDFYDFFPLDETHLALVIADVSGKGIPAALFMMMAQNMIKNYARSGLSPAEVLSRTNRDVLENENNTMFVTVWLGYYETTTGHILAVDAGHEYPMIRKKDGLFELIKDRHSLVVGGVENAVYREYELQLNVGDTLFLYTDGATEATNTDKQMLGTDGVLNALNCSPDDSPEELIEGVGKRISAFVGDAPQFDDLTMLAFKRTR